MSAISHDWHLHSARRDRQNVYDPLGEIGGGMSAGASNQRGFADLIEKAGQSRRKFAIVQKYSPSARERTKCRNIIVAVAPLKQINTANDGEIRFCGTTVWKSDNLFLMSGPQFLRVFA